MQRSDWTSYAYPQRAAETIQISFLLENEMIKAEGKKVLAECKQKGKVNNIRL
jgi:hypothetical protein